MMIVKQGEEEEMDLHNNNNNNNHNNNNMNQQHDDDDEEVLLLLPPKKDPFHSLFTNFCAGSGGGGGVPLILCDPYAKKKSNHERDCEEERHHNNNKKGMNSGVESPLSPLSIGMDTTATLEDDEEEDHCTLSTTSTVEAGVGSGGPSFKRTMTNSSGSSGVVVPRILIDRSCLVQEDDNEEEKEEATKTYTRREQKKKNKNKNLVGGLNRFRDLENRRRKTRGKGTKAGVVPLRRTTTTAKPLASTTGDNLLLKKAGQVLLFLALILYVITSSVSSLQHKNQLKRVEQEQLLLQQDHPQQQQQQRDLRILQQELDLFVSPGTVISKAEFNVNRWWNAKGRQQLLGTLRGATVLPVVNADDYNNKAIAIAKSDEDEGIVAADTAAEKSRKRRSRRIGYVLKPFLSQMNEAITQIVKEGRGVVVRQLGLGKQQQRPEEEEGNNKKGQRLHTKETNPTTRKI